jgi:hypothetical protein
MEKMCVIVAIGGSLILLLLWVTRFSSPLLDLELFLSRRFEEKITRNAPLIHSIL